MPHPTTQITLVIADDHLFYRQGLRAWLASFSHIQLVGEAGNGEELCALVKLHSPQVVITDLSMPRMNGVEATRWIKTHTASTSVIVLSVCEDTEQIKSCIGAGATSYLLKDEPIETLLEAVDCANKGKYYMSTMLSWYFSQTLTPLDQKVRLTKREKEILSLIFNEYTSRQIGDLLHLSERTIEDHRKHLQQKTGSKNIVGLIKYALKNKFVKLQ